MLTVAHLWMVEKMVEYSQTAAKLNPRRVGLRVGSRAGLRAATRAAKNGCCLALRRKKGCCLVSRRAGWRACKMTVARGRHPTATL